MNYYVIYSNSSRNNGGLKPQLRVFGAAHIIESAEYEMRKFGESFEELAGINCDADENGNIIPERELTYDEVVELSANKLSDDGRMFFIYPATDDGAIDFIEDAEGLNLKDDALRLVLGHLGA